MEQRKVDTIMDNSLFGVSYYGIGYPIDLQGEPGALVVILPPNYHVLKHEPFRFLTGKQQDEWSPVPVEQITYIESLQKKTWFYAENERFIHESYIKGFALTFAEYVFAHSPFLHRQHSLYSTYYAEISLQISYLF